MSRQRTALATLLALEALALAVPSIALAQSTQDWTAPLNGNQPGLTQWTLPGPLAADAQGRVLATAYVRELLPVYPPVTPIVAELITLRDSNGLTLWSQRQPTSHSTSQVVASPTGGFLALSSSSAITALQLSWYHPDGVQTWTMQVTGLLRTGMYIYDNSYVLMELKTAQRFADLACQSLVKGGGQHDACGKGHGFAPAHAVGTVGHAQGGYSQSRQGAAVHVVEPRG